MGSFYRRFIYRRLMQLAHRYNWHHITISYPEGDTKRTCQWCGMTEVLKRDYFMGMKICTDLRMPKNAVIMTNIEVPRWP